MMPPDPAPPAIPPEVPTPPLRPGRLWALALGAAIVAGLTSWLVGEVTLDRFVPKPNLVTVMGITMNRPTFHDRTVSEFKNVALAFGGFGALFGAAMGLAGAHCASRPKLYPAMVGLILGTVAGVVASAALLPIYHKQLDVSPEELSADMVLPFLIHGGIWTAIGAAASAAFGIGLGGGRRLVLATLGGLAGALLGTAIYEFIGALAFPDGKTSEPLAAAMGARLLARLAVSVCTASLAVLAILETRRPAGGKKNAGPLLDPIDPKS